MTKLPRTLLGISVTQLSFALLTLFLTYWLLFAASWSNAINPQFARPHAIFLSTLFVAFAVLHFVGKLEWKRSPVDLWWFVFTAILLISGAANPAHWPNIFQAYWLWGAFTLLALIISDCVANRLVSRSSLAIAIQVAAVPVTIDACVDLMRGIERGGSFSTFENANYFGGLMGILVPITFIQFRAKPSWQQGMFLGIFSAGTLVSQSYGAFLGLAMVLIVMDRKRRLIYLALMVFWAILGTQFRLASAGERMHIYQLAIEVFKRNFVFGTGPFTFREGPHLQAHNLFLHTSAELGLLGLIFLIVIVLAGTRDWKHLRPDQKPWAAALLSSLGNQMVDVIWLSPGLSVVLLIVFAGLFQSESSTSRRFQNATSVVVVITAVTLCLFSIRSGGLDGESFKQVRDWSYFTN